MKQKKIPFADKVDSITHEGLAEMVFVLWGKHDRIIKFLKRNHDRLSEVERGLKKLHLDTVENKVEVQDMIGNIDFVTRGLTSLEGDFFAYIGEPDEGDEDTKHPLSEEATQEKIAKLTEEIHRKENKTEETVTLSAGDTKKDVYDRYLDNYEGGYMQGYGCKQLLNPSNSINDVKKVCTIQINKQNKTTKKEYVIKK